MGGVSLTGCCTVLAILLLRALTGRRIPRRIFVLLWVGALLVLLVPGTFTSPFSLYALLPRPARALAATASAAAARAPALWSLLRRTVTGLALLGLGAACLLSLLRLCPARPAIAPAVNDWLAAHPLLRPLRVCVGRTAAPVCCGILLPRIVLPEDFDLDDRATLDCVLSHEYVHVCRFDPLLKLFFAVALCLRWYDPLVWIAALTAGRDIEYACDEAVLDAGIPAKRYAAVLLRAALRRAERLPLTARFNAGQLERRVERITVHRAGSPLSWLAAGALGLSLLLCLGTVPEASKAVPTELPHSSFLSSVPHSVCKPDAWTWRSALPSREPSSAPSAPDIR